MMRDDALSALIRKKKGLPEEWRVYLYEAVDTKSGPKVKLTGALARPATKYDGPKEGWPVWYRPLQMRVSMTVSREQYEAMLQPAPKEKQP